MTDEKTTDVAEETETAETEAEATETVDFTEAPAEEEFEFAEDPTFEVDYKGDCAYEVKVVVPAANEKKQAEELFEELLKDAQVPGFRKGRAPRALVENKFGKVVRTETIDKLVKASVGKLIKDNDLEPMDFPDVDGLDELKEAKPGTDLAFTLKFEVFPSCTLGEYKGVAIEQPVLKVADEDVDAAIMDMRGRFATYETVEGATAGDGDQVIIDFEGKIDGEAFAGGSAQNYPYIVGSGRFFAEFETALQGAKSGSEIACDVAFPEDYSNKQLGGKTANFTITVNEVKQKQMPEFDDEFAKQAGFDSAEAMKTKVREDLQEASSEQGRGIAERDAMKQIVAASTFEIPVSLIESSANEYYEQERRRLGTLRVPYAEIEAKDEAIRKEAREDAEQNIKAFVAINEIGRAEAIQVTEDDFLKEAEAIQKRTGMGMEVVTRYLQQQDQLNEYRSRIYRQKAMDVVWDNAKITQKEVTREEMEAQNEQDDE